MTHVDHQLERWLGGELDAAAAAVVEAHLAGCAACRREAETLRATWQALDLAAPRGRADSVWPAVQARTFGPRRGWFFAGRPLVQAGLVAAAVACGVAAGVLLPAGGGATAGEATLWVASSRALDDGSTGALDVWLDPGVVEVGDPEVAR